MAIQLKTSVLLSPFEDGYLAYQTDTEHLHQLNSTAALIVELCDGTRGLGELRDELLPLTGRDTWGTCAQWIAQALEDGLLVDSDAHRPDSAGDPPALSVDRMASMARALREDGRVLPAFVCQQHVVERAPHDPAAWYALAELAHIVGRRADARAAYERYFAFHPEDAEVAHILTALRDEPAPRRASIRYVEQLYSRFASFYDESMLNDLEYCAPVLLFDSIVRARANEKHDSTDANAAGTRADRVLDLGCGTGLHGRLWRGRARHLVGIDLSPDMIERARAHGVYDALHVAEITEWLSRPDVGDGAEPRPDRFDMIVACDALIYFGDLRQVLVPARRWIAPGGIFGFTVERLDERTSAPGFQLSDSGRYVHHPDHIVEAARDAGLSVARMDDGVLRYEYGEPVRGLIVVLRA